MSIVHLTHLCLTALHSRPDSWPVSTHSYTIYWVAVETNHSLCMPMFHFTMCWTCLVVCLVRHTTSAFHHDTLLVYFGVIHIQFDLLLVYFNVIDRSFSLWYTTSPFYCDKPLVSFTLFLWHTTGLIYCDTPLVSFALTHNCSLLLCCSDIILAPDAVTSYSPLMLWHTTGAFCSDILLVCYTVTHY